MNYPVRDFGLALVASGATLWSVGAVEAGLGVEAIPAVSVGLVLAGIGLLLVMVSETVERTEEPVQRVPGLDPERETGTPASRLGEAIKQTQIARRDATYDVGVTDALTEAEMLLRGARDRHDDLRRCGAARVAADGEEGDAS